MDSNNGLGFSFVIGGGLVDLGGRSSRSSTKGCGDVGGDPNSSIGSSLGKLGGDGDLDGWVGAFGGLGSMGVLVGGGVVCSFGCLGDGVVLQGLESIHFGWVRRIHPKMMSLG